MNISTHRINIDDIIKPSKYLSAGVNGITFVSSLTDQTTKRSKKKKGKESRSASFSFRPEKLPEVDPKGKEEVIVKYEVVRDRDYKSCQDSYLKCIDRYKNITGLCKTQEIYCRLESAFIEIYINKLHIQNLKCRNFAMFYAFFMCPTFSISFDKENKPTRNFINKFIENKRFCVENEKNEELNQEKLHVFSVYEYIKGKTLKEYLTSKEFNIISYYEIMLQIFGALSIAQIPNTLYYNHNDLHCSNVMIQSYPNKKEYEYSYEFPYEKTLNKVKSNKRAVIIDQGNASLVFKNCDMKRDTEYCGVFGWYRPKTSKVLGSYNTPYMDVFRILTLSYAYLMDVDSPHIKDIKYIIDDLFSIKRKGYKEMCSNFIKTESNISLEYYFLYIEKILSRNDYDYLIKKIEFITYEFAYNYIYYANVK
jgi:serine/threonine protein kinase